MLRFFIFITFALFSSPVWAERCPEGRAVTDYPRWEYIANNAVRTADLYATYRRPEAVFVFSEAKAYYQVSGEYEGGYLVMLSDETPRGTVFAVLKPNFDFCSDPSKLDDSREDLFTVVGAKIQGVPF